MVGSHKGSQGVKSAILATMTTPSVAASPGVSNDSVEDDDILWMEYLKEAANTDACLVKDWTKVIDVLLVFVRCQSSSSISLRIWI